MIGWAVFFALAGACYLGVRLIGRVRGPEATLVLAALATAAAGYAGQGSPTLPGVPAQAPRGATLSPDTLYMVERTRLTPAYGEAGQYLILADGLTRAGDGRAAAAVLRGALARHPRDPQLATGYAYALFALAGKTFTPAVTLAFDRATAIAPADPAPRYFEGLAQLESNDVPTAIATWTALRDGQPTGSGWRRVIDQRLAVVATLMRR